MSSSLRVLMTFYGDGIGGDAAVFLDLAEALLARGLEVTLAPRADRPEVLEERARARGLTLVPASDWRGWTDRLREFDLVHLHHCSNYVLPAQAHKLASAFRGLPLIATLHGPEPLESFLTGRRGLSAKLSARYFAALVVPSRHKFLAWQTRGFFPGKLRQIPNPIRAIELQDRRQAKAALELPADMPCLLFLGRIRAEKTPGAIFTAIPHLLERGIEPVLVFAGRGDEALSRMLEETAKELGVEAKFLGFVPEPSQAYSAADAFLFTSRFDNFPIALFEAAAAGVPIAAVRLPVTEHEFTGRAGVFTYDPGDAVGLAQATIRALGCTDPERAQLKRETLERFGFASVAQRHEELYRHLLSKAAPAAST